MRKILLASTALFALSSVSSMATDITLSGTLDVTGDTSLKSALEVTGNTEVNGELKVKTDRFTVDTSGIQL